MSHHHDIHSNCSCNHTHHDHNHDTCHCHEGECACGHEHIKLNNKDLIIFAISALIFITSAVLKIDIISKISALTAILICGYKIFISGIKSLIKLKFDENTLIVIAVIATILMKEYGEGYIITLLFGIGQYLEEYAIEKSNKRIEELIFLDTDVAYDENGNKTDPKTIKIGDKILLRPGDKSCIDGVILSGSTSLDTSSLTGESMPMDVSVGDTILSGMINLTNSVVCSAITNYHNSTDAKIRDYIKKSAQKKASTEKFITKFAKIYTPIVLFVSLAIALVFPLFEICSLTDAIKRALTFMIASCPCSLVISIPLSYFAAIGTSGKNGILIKGSKYINLLAKADTVAFDKTGTLTKGEITVRSITCEDWITEDKALMYASALEKYSSHPIAKAICNHFNADTPELYDVKEFFGKGLIGYLDNTEILAGNHAFAEQFGLSGACDHGVNLYIDKKKAAVIKLTDTIKIEAKETLQNLRKLGIKTIAVLSGDTKSETEKIKEYLSADYCFGALLPNDKAEEIEKFKRNKKTVIFVGDGVNDAPALASADVSIAVASGSGIALENGDITLLNNSLCSIIKAIKISRYAMKIIYANIIFSLITKLAVLFGAALGVAPIWLALFADVGVLIITVLNSLTITKH